MSDELRDGAGYNGEDFPRVEDLRPYVGRWIAYVGTAIVASEDSLAKTVKAARAKGCADAALFLVPPSGYR